MKKRIGPAWASRGRPAASYHTKRTAEAWLRDILDEARRGTLPGMVRTGATFAVLARRLARNERHRPTLCFDPGAAGDAFTIG